METYYSYNNILSWLLNLIKYKSSILSPLPSPHTGFNVRNYIFYIVYPLIYILVIFFIFLFFNFCDRIKSALYTTVTVLQYSVLFCIFTFISKLYISICFCIAVKCPFISTWRSLFSISYNIGTEMRNSFNFYFSRKLFISLSFLKARFCLM